MLQLPWERIHTVLLDMDGTLLDLHFDNVFFRQIVPEHYARARGLEPDVAWREVMATYERVRGTLAWYDVDFWSRELGLDLPLIKLEVAHLIQVHPHVLDFLVALDRSGRRAHLVTNAHAHSLNLKLARTPIGAHMASVTSSHELGLPKEDPAFWGVLQQRLPLDPATTLLADDSEPVLASASAFGIRWLLHIAAPSSSEPPRHSQRFPSVAGFSGVNWPGAAAG
ncbi:MAG: GMP/IMP nucleotidase [Magnetococcus sp. WYHC-3]